MTLKVGDTCYRVFVDSGAVEFWEYHLRTIRKRPHGTAKIGYWFPKLPGLWGKLSTKHGDFGWLPNIDAFRVAKRIEAGRPYATTKAGALRDEIARIRASLRDETDQEIIDEMKADLGPLLRAQKRLKSKKD